ncbi:hypothetical protein ACWDWU_16775 [Streptomyces sp. NPDC003442]
MKNVAGRLRGGLSVFARLRTRLGAEATQWDWWHTAMFACAGFIGALLGITIGR